MKKVLLLIVSIVFCGSIFAQYESYWPDIEDVSVCPDCYPANYFENQDPLIAMVKLDDHLMTPLDNYAAFEVAAFVGGNYRGHGFLHWYEEYDDDYPILQFAIFYKPVEANIYEPANPNEISLPVTFKLYDHSTNTLYDYWTCTQEIVTQVMYASYDFTEMPVISFFHTFKKEIDPYTTDGGYYLIASPLNEEVMAKDVVGLRTPEFDFYSFDQNPEGGLEWINHRNQEEYTLQSGVGYLYANSTGEDLIFVGAPYAGDGKVTLAKEEGPNVEFPGWNLVGNPFAQTASIDRTEFYVMNGDGDEVITADRNYVNAMEGIFVIAATDGEKITFSPTPTNGKGQIVLNLTGELGSTLDRAVVRFGQGGTLPKFMLNENNTKMYIPKDGKDFAVVRSNKSGRLPLSFEPARDGVYFINVDTENVEVKYLHLIDHQEGIDVDLLQCPSYKFYAKVEGKPNRFELVFKTGSIFEALSTKDAGDSFGFCNNGNWIINNEGEAILQVVDVNGQILSSEEINGSVSKHIEAAPGVYMLRLINGKDMKVQKIVVE
jgi:hypothetical protein